MTTVSIAVSFARHDPIEAVFTMKGRDASKGTDLEQSTQSSPLHDGGGQQNESDDDIKQQQQQQQQSDINDDANATSSQPLLQTSGDAKARRTRRMVGGACLALVIFVIITCAPLFFGCVYSIVTFSIFFIIITRLCKFLIRNKSFHCTPQGLSLQGAKEQ